MTTPASDYRSDSEDANISATSSMSGGYGIFDMGASTDSYNLDEWIDPSTKTISRDMAINYWGSWYDYTVVAPEDMYVDINIKYNLKWIIYGRIAAYGLEPGTSSYQIEGATELNWPKHYTGSMILMLDGNNLKTTQTARPIAPDEFQSTGSNFTKIVKDTANWQSTLVNGLEPNDTLWMWPVQGRYNTLTSRYNATPDYKSVFLSKGVHTFRIKSLCSSWNFDCMKIVINQTSGLQTLVSTNNRNLNVFGGRGTIVINEKHPVIIYDINGRLIAHASTTISVPSGIYIVKGEQSAKKVVVN
ncbi:MAG: T9SS type A sorting domain-containing protein [Muribaculaceae bacterium]|nr:T9SS type A sorting domain-containing protein [Muribaculaceae bacterium]MBR6431669.1 T9SS type A sorting domain-containing protein [Muribaculaceae bacterium]